MFCEKCGYEISENTTICPNCKNAVMPTDSVRSQATKENGNRVVPPSEENVKYAFNPPVYQKPKTKTFNISIISVIVDVLGTLSGIISSILSFVIKGLEKKLGYPYLFSFTDYETYGGDAYTGVQHAAADTSNNIWAFAGLFIDISSAVLFCISLFILFYFLGKLIREIKAIKK